MALATLAQFKLLRGITNTAQDDLLTMLLASATATANAYTHRNLEKATYTEYYSGGRRSIVLLQHPVLSITNLWLDLGGHFGQAPNAFAAAPLVYGTDYELELENGGRAESGLVTRISGSMGGFTGEWSSNFQSGYGPGTLTAQGAAPAWPNRKGCIKVTYVAGYDSTANPSTVPADLTQAVLELANWFYLTRETAGNLYQSEQLSKYQYSLMPRAGAGEPPELGSARDLLSRYRDQVF